MTLEQPIESTTTGGTRATPAPITTRAAQPTPRKGSAGSDPECDPASAPEVSRRARNGSAQTKASCVPYIMQSLLLLVLLLNWASPCRSASLATSGELDRKQQLASGGRPTNQALDDVDILELAPRELPNRPSDEEEEEKEKAIELFETEIALREAILFVREQLQKEPQTGSSQVQRIKRSGISDQRLAEIQMIRALKKQLVERASKLASDASTAAPTSGAAPAS